jgi:hypothetical protein
MTEAEWLTATDPTPMLAALRGTASARKLRLFCCPCARRVWGAIADKDVRRAVEAAERNADQLTDNGDPMCGRGERRLAPGGPRHGTEYAAECAADAAGTAEDPIGERAAQRGLLADIFGPLPYRPLRLDPGLLSATVRSLVSGIVSECAFDRLPILADALQDAGCENVDILNHCRDPEGGHVRGCWVVDLLAGGSSDGPILDHATHKTCRTRGDVRGSAGSRSRCCRIVECYADLIF